MKFPVRVVDNRLREVHQKGVQRAQEMLATGAGGKVRTGDGNIVVIRSNNVEERTINVYPQGEVFDAEYTTLTEMSYDDVIEWVANEH